ncbi:hypothetical protein Ahy_A03g014427 isoform A [Arachis hypogaea]|uniref:Protein kish n=2 Tax=Arachis hypogaea TaxID=3818 RepID=A0A445DXM7_ARAHY|nr:hypothetical protein Ahy_A03g014427 isoform A [Arachis hypogaea]
MSALFNFHSFLTVILLGICACTYFKMQFPAVLEQRTGICLELAEQVTLMTSSFATDFVGSFGRRQE